MGFPDCVFVPAFTNQELAHELRLMLPYKLKVVDDTPVVPEGPNGSWLDWPLASLQLEARSVENPDEVHVVLRTSRNTASYLGGVLYKLAAQLGSTERAIHFVKKNRVSTPSGCVFYGGGLQATLPASVCQSGATKVASIIAATVLHEPSRFCCDACDKSFITLSQEEEGGEIEDYMATACDHCFHPECVLELFRNGNGLCPVCGDNLPLSWDRRRCIVPPPLTGSAEEQAEQLDKLADDVRRTMIEDGLIDDEF